MLKEKDDDTIEVNDEVRTAVAHFSVQKQH
jgi:hypothetical protein